MSKDRTEFLKELAELCERHRMLLIGRIRLADLAPEDDCSLDYEMIDDTMFQSVFTAPP